MPRSYGITNVAPYASAPAVGAAGDEYYNTGNKALYISDGTAWNPIQGGGGGGQAWVGTIANPAAGTTYTLTHNLNTSTPFVQLWDAITTAQILGQVVASSPNQIQVSFSVKPPNNVTVVVGGISAVTAPATVGPWVGTLSILNANTPYNVTHNLNTMNPIVQIYDAVTLTQIAAQITIINAGAFSVTFAQVPPNNVTVVVSTGGSTPAPAGTTLAGPWTGSITGAVANTAYNLTHNLNANTPLVQLYDAVTRQQIAAQVTSLDANRISVMFAVAPPNTVNVVVSTGGGTPGPPAANVYYLTYYQTIPAVQSGSPYVLNHRLNSTQVMVQLWDAVTLQQIMAQLQIVDANNVRISVAQNMPNNVNAVVMIGPSTPAAVNPGDMAAKSYVDARTPNLPAPVTSGTTIQTFTDALGDVWVAQNNVYAGAWKRARDVVSVKYTSTSVATSPATANTYFNVLYNVKGFDPYNLYNSATGLFTCPVPGIYYIKATYSCSPAANISVTMQIYKNGAAGEATGTACMAVGVPMAQAYSLAQCVAGDTLAGWGAVGQVNTPNRGNQETMLAISYMGTG